jgi:hypothetical protein
MCAVLTWLPPAQVLLPGPDHLFPFTSFSSLFTLQRSHCATFRVILLTMAPKKKSKVDLSHLRALIQLKTEPTPLTKKDVKAMWIPSSNKLYEYTMAL